MVSGFLNNKGLGQNGGTYESTRTYDNKNRICRR